MKAVLFHENKTVDYGKGPIEYQSGHTYLFRRDKADRWIRRGAGVEVDLQPDSEVTPDPAGQHIDHAFGEELRRRWENQAENDDFAEALRLAGKTAAPPAVATTEPPAVETTQPPTIEAPANDPALGSTSPVATTDGGDIGQRPVDVPVAGKPMPRAPAGGRGNSRK